MSKAEKEEEWRAVLWEGNETFYEVSDKGRVRNKETNRLKKLQKNGSGYMKTILHIDKIQKAVFAHRLVAMAFIPNPNNYSDVNHKNKDRADNRVENLEWVTKSQNMKHSHENGHKSFKRAVNQYDLDDNLIKTHESIRAAAKNMNTHPRNIDRCLREGQEQYGGYKWRYANELPKKIEIEELRKMCKENNILMKELESDKNYIILSDGRVYTKLFKKFLTQAKIGNYLTVNIRDKRKRIHILIAKTFVKNPENKPIVNHKDLDKSNNDYRNLEWSTHQENMIHATKLLKKGYVGVSQYTRENKLVKSFENMRLASRETGINEHSISNVASGRRKTAGGYIWKRD